jgi:hypothetical protein
MWYDERGQGDPLVALHPGGAGVDSRALTPQLEALAEHFRVYASPMTTRSAWNTPSISTEACPAPN